MGHGRLTIELIDRSARAGFQYFAIRPVPAGWMVVSRHRDYWHANRASFSACLGTRTLEVVTLDKARELLAAPAAMTTAPSATGTVAQ